jgi:hypothetical protein
MSQIKHGAAKRGAVTSEYRIWKNIMQRCYNPRATAYSYYGGRGIRVCKRWHDYKNFLADMGPRPSRQHTVDRENSNKWYGPKNCRWATKLEQMNNMRSNRSLEAFGETKTMAEWNRELKAGRNVVQYHLSKGRDIEWIVVFLRNRTPEQIINRSRSKRQVEIA